MRLTGVRAGKQLEGMNMMRSTSLGTIAAVALLAIAAPQPAPAQSAAATKPAPCSLAWCPVLVQVVKNTSGADVVWVSVDQMRLTPKYSGATLIWELVGSPDYEFRADSVTAKGANAAIARAQFPLRRHSANPVRARRSQQHRADV